MSEEFLALPLEDVLELVSRDELNVKSEEQVCGAASAGDAGGCCCFLIFGKSETAHSVDHGVCASVAS